MGIFDGMNSTTTGGRRYLDPGGTYMVKILKCGKKDAKDSFKGFPSFFVELEVTTSDVKSCPAGTVANWTVAFKPGKNTGLEAKQSNVKQFLAAAVGMMTVFDTPDPTNGQRVNAEDFAEAVCSPAQPLAGRFVGVKVTNKKLTDGEDFSKHVWFPAG